ncbi:MAG: hypothetical protein H3C26_02180 [Rhodocyclaceae bacterium]|nr:hypothetical protein [Rhodocyclaceae bacterium]
MRFRSILIAAAAALLAACATPARLVDSWQDGDYRAAPLRRLLVLGFGEDGAGRRLFEDELVRALKAQGVDAVPSYALASGVHEADVDRVRELVTQSAADGVLATRLAGMDRRITTTPGQVTAVPTMVYRRGFYGYYPSTVWVHSPPTTRGYDVVRLETNLWQASGERLIWSGATENDDAATAHRGSRPLAETIARVLKERGLI